MEKLILLVALSGSIYLALMGIWRLAKSIVSSMKGGPRKPVVVLPTKPPTRDKWAEYEIPTFIRRGIPMPKLEPVQAKSRTKKRRKVKAAGEAKEAATTFEVVA